MEFAASTCMPRKAREEVEGGIFHVYARGNDKRLIFRDDVDRTTYLRMLRGTVKQRRWRLLAYCLMPNHVHLLVETPHANLAAGMQRMHGLYARDFNDRHGRSGHVFQGRYGSVRAETDEQLWGAAAYIAMNPVAAGLCKEPEEWPWGSHRAIVRGGGPRWLDVARLLEHLAGAGRDPGHTYADMFREMREARPRGRASLLERDSLVESPGGTTAVAAPSR
jgi:REP element-mobilizing transposase RayT